MKNFQILSKLGEGSFSQVYKAKRISDGQEYAMKKVQLGQLKDKDKENALNEIRILASIDDPFIIGYKEAFLDEQSYNLCIIMEYADGGDLQKKIQEALKKKTLIPEFKIWKMFYQMLQALKTLHSMTILHRDLKSANVFITKNDDFKLGDMNVSKVAKKGFVQTQTGTPYYASPEVWRDEPYNAKSDIWSLGCVAYEMAALKPPFRAQDMEGLFQRVQKGVCDRIPSKYSGDLMQIISICLQINAGQRPTCDQLLQHPVFMRNTVTFQKNQVKQTTIEDQNENSFSYEEKNILLQTIKVPRNLKKLKSQLPKSKYTPSFYDGNQSYEDNEQQKNNQTPFLNQQLQNNKLQGIRSQSKKQLSKLDLQNRGNQHSAYEHNRAVEQQYQLNKQVSSPIKQYQAKQNQRNYIFKRNHINSVQKPSNQQGVNNSIDQNESMQKQEFMETYYNQMLNEKLSQKQRNLLGSIDSSVVSLKNSQEQLPSIKYQNPDFAQKKQLGNQIQLNQIMHNEQKGNLVQVKQNKMQQNRILKEAEQAKQLMWWG